MDGNLRLLLLLLCVHSCEYFRTMFQSGMKEADSPEIMVTDVRLPAFRRLLMFLYTGNCSFNEVRTLCSCCSTL